MGATASIHPEFGHLICHKRGAVKYWLLSAVLFAVSIGALWLTISLLTAQPTTLPLTRGEWLAGKRAPTVQRNDPPTALLIGVAVAIAGVAVWPLRIAMTRVAFYEHGATRRVWGQEISIPYTSATSLQYELVAAKSHYGIHGGVAVSLSFESADGQRIVYSGDLQQSPLEPMSIFSGKFETTDKIGLAMHVIASFVADRWQETILGGGTRDWCEAATFDRNGLTVRRGKHRDQTFAWSAIRAGSLRDGQLELDIEGKGRFVVPAKPGSVDFYPGLQLVARMVEARRGNPAAS